MLRQHQQLRTFLAAKNKKIISGAQPKIGLKNYLRHLCNRYGRRKTACSKVQQHERVQECVDMTKKNAEFNGAPRKGGPFRFQSWAICLYNSSFSSKMQGSDTLATKEEDKKRNGLKVDAFCEPVFHATKTLS